MSIPDAYDLWKQRERQEQKWLDSRPKCDHCNRPIQDEKLCDFDGTLICFECVENHYTKHTEDYTA